MKLFLTKACFLSLPICLLAGLSNASLASGLEYNDNTKSIVPIPMAEALLTTATARHFQQVNKKPYTLEGALFANNGDIYFCEGTTNSVIVMNPNGNLKTVANFGDKMPAGLAFHPNGKIYATVVGKNKGAIYAMQPDGTGKKVILPEDAGYIPNDLAISSKGGIYFTDFKGNMTDPAGGVYYLAPNSKDAVKVIGNIANANGIALSPDEKVLWVGDYGRSILFRIELEDETHIDRIHSTPVYYFTGRGPDGICTDSDGNAYVALISQGRVLVFNPRGLPIGQILLPDREKGKNLYSSSLAIKPKARDLVIVARDTTGSGSNIFVTEAFANGKPNHNASIGQDNSVSK